MDASPHFEFILAAYGAALLIMGAVTVWVMLDHAALKRALSGLADDGVTRRSDEQMKTRP
jgi:heme exporter protein CcmD